MELTISRADLDAQCGMMVSAAPEVVRRAVIADKQFARDVGLKIKSTLTSQLGYVVEVHEFTRMLREVVGGAASVTFRTSAGETVAATASVDADGAAHLVTPTGTLFQPLAALLGDDQARRMATFATFAARVMLPAARAKEWRDLVAERPLATDEFWELSAQSDKTPEVLHDRLQQLQTHDVPTLVPTEDLYWECLLPAPLDTYAAWRDAALPTWRMELLAAASPWRLSRAGFAAVCRAPMPSAFAEGADKAALDALCSQEDPFSLLLALEITAAGAALDEDAVTRGSNLLERLLGQTDEASRRIGLFWAAMIVAHTGAQRSAKWRKAPLYWRRMAVLAHAGLITNALFHAYPDAPTFMSWAGNQGGMTLILGTIRDRRHAPHWHVMSTAAVRAMVVERAYIAVASVPADRRPPEWASLTEAAIKDGGDLIDAFFPGPLSDFEGYVPPLPREDFAETMEDLRRRAPPGDLRVFSLFVNAVPLDADDLTVVEGYVKALDVARPEEQATCVTTLGIAAGAAAAYRHVGLAEAIRDKVVALFPHVDGNRRRELLGTLLDASNAYELAKAGWPWAARAFERLGHGAANQGELAALATVTRTLRRIDPESGPYFASVDAIVRLRWPHLP